MTNRIYKVLLSVICFIGLGYSIQAQEVPFTPRLDDSGNTYLNIKGDYTFLSNSVMNSVSNGHDVNTPYNGNGSNNSLHVEYVDIDSDPTTFNSSSSTLSLPSCSQIYWAGLYWAGNYDVERDGDHRSRYVSGYTDDPNHYDVTEVKLRVPGSATYIDLQADTAPDPVGEEDDIIVNGYNILPNDPYVCYKNVTNILQGLADPTGDYFVANVRGTRGATTYGCAGWTLVVIYENPTLPGRYISVFDGYEGVTTQSGNRTADINVNGFNTIPVGPVNARIGVSTLEGETSLSGDTFGIVSNSSSTFTDISNAANPNNNFFNSTISEDGANVTSRNVSSTNAIGFDSDVFDLNNPGNSIIDNGDTDATLRLGTNGDWFASFLVTFAVEIIEPTIVLEKKVEDIGGNDITGAGVNLGQYLDYVLSFVNTGNDDATNYTIRDVLPANVDLDTATITMPAGVTYTYDAATREVVFNIPDNLVEEGDPVSEIRMRVQVAENCFDFVDACTDIIENLAYSTYEGVINSNQISDDPSVSDFDDCGFTTPGATNFLLDDLSACNFTRTVELCGSDVLLDAGDNFDAYIWYLDQNGDNLIDAGDTVLNDGDSDGDPSTFLVDAPGTYMVDKQVADPCKDFTEIIIVELFAAGSGLTNPITALINDTSNSVDGQIVVCPNDGSELPEVFLCGLNDTELIQVNIPDADSIEWEQLDEASCAASIAGCANTDNSCTWNNVGNGNDFLASAPGEYRLVVNYQNGCFRRFNFNIYQNPLDPQYTSSDIICNTDGNITVTNMPVDYEFRLIDQTTGTVLVGYNPNPSFDITTNGAYTVEMRQQGVTDGCVFVLDNIGILDRDFQVDVTTRDTDCNGLGEIAISVLNVEAQYYYEISQGGTVVDTHGPSADNNYTFQNLNDGVYDVDVTTDDGCVYNEQVTINDVTDLAVTAITTKNIDCTDGIITVTGSGGFPNPDYAYAIWSYNGTDLYASVGDIPGGAFQFTSDFNFTNGEEGDYEFVVVDGNNCSFISNSVSIVVAPSIVYTTAATDETCFGIADGTFAVNVTNSNGYSLSYTLTYPDTSTANNASGLFTGLPQGAYSLTITQTQGAVSCDFIETFNIGGPTSGVAGDAVLIQDYTCLQDGIIEVQNVAGGTAPYEYSIDGVNFVSGAGAETFSNLTNGSFDITIRDANNCTFTTNAITFDPLNPPTDLTFSASTPVCPALTSDVTVTAVNGNAPFVFEITAPAPVAATSITGASADFDALAPGTYTFRVTDNKGCVYDESFTINPVSQISVVGNLVSNITCFTDTDGEIDFIVSDFNTDYDYSVTGPANFNGNAQTTGTISLTGLDDGTYTIVVTDNLTNCTATTDVTVNAPSAALTLNASEVQPTCIADGSVTLTSTGGWGGNSFTLTNPDTTVFGTNSTGAFTGLVQSGSYTATVTDVNGCVVTTNFTLNAAVPPALAIVPNSACYDDAVGLTLTANVTSGGDGNFEYSLNGGAFGTNNVFAGLTSGTYTIDVRDGNSCTDSASITVNPELTVLASAPNITTCGTDTDVLITAAGGDNNYVYAIVADGVAPTPGDFGAANPITITGAGDYDVYVRDNNGGAGYCEANYDLSIAQDAPLGLVISDTGILCSGEAQATISITASGGEAPYEYSINNGATYQPSNTFVNQLAGSYNIRVRDANNCDITQIYNISEPLTLSASAAVTQLAECNPGIGAEVRITNALGGTAPYEYSFDGGSNYAATSIGYLLPGSHTVYIRDANNCTFPMNVIVDPEPTPPGVTTAIDYECDGEGTVTVTPDSATFDYTYEIDGNPNTPATSNVFNDVTVGSHTITVNYTSNVPPSPSVLLLENFGAGPNTSITEVDPNYCYEPLDGSGIGCNTSPNSLSNGEYTVTQVLTNPWSGWRPPNDHTGNPNGRFLAIDLGTVVGLDGIIYAKRNIEIIPNRDLTISMELYNMVRDTHGGTQNDPNVRIELVDPFGTVIDFIATGNIPRNTNADDWHNYSVDLNPGANTNIDVVIRTNINTNHGNDLAIDDIQAFQTPEVCAGTLTVDVNIEAGNAFEASITSFNDISCNAGNDGSISFEVENFDAVNGFEYQVNGGGYSAPQTASPITIPALAAGNYTIEVRDVLDNSCIVTLNQALSEPTPVATTASTTSVMTCTNGGATITASASGGTPNYEFQLEDGVGGIIAGFDYATNGNNSVFTGLAPGDYIVRARDTNLCEDPIDAAITIVAPTTLTFTTTPTACYSGANDGTIQVDVTAGNGDYQFSIAGGPWITPTPASATTHTFSNLAAGTYTIDVRDGFGCAGVQQSVTINDQLLGAAVLTQDLTCLVNASVTINTSGGSGTYSYEWSNDGGTNYFSTNFVANVFTTATDGTYQFRVTDTTAPTSCTIVTNAVVVTPADTPVITSVVPTDVVCNGNTDGSLAVTIDTTIGVGPYVIEVIETTGPTNYGTQTTNLPAGNYEVRITDAKGCVSAPTAVSIAEPAVIAPNTVSTNLQCTPSGTELGTITVDASGGTAAYIYNVYNADFSVSMSYDTSTGTNDHTFTGLDFGDYTLSVTDANGCQDLSTVTITTGPDVLIATQGTAGCTPGSGEMLVEAQASNGTLGVGTFYFAIFPAPAFNALDPAWFPEDPSPPAPANSHLFTGLTPGVTYTFIVHDSDTNCEYVQEATVPVSSTSALAATIDATTNITCTGAADGIVDFTVSGYGGSDVSYEIFAAVTNTTTGITGTISGVVGGPETDTATGLAPGEFYILFTETNGPNTGCVMASPPFVIEQAPIPLDVSATSTNDIECADTGTISASAQFGAGTYEYQLELQTAAAPTAATWTGTNTNGLFSALANDDYTVYVKDANDCIDHFDITVGLDPRPEVSLAVVDECVAEGTFEVLVTLTTPGSSPYQLSVNGGPYQNITFNGSNQYTVSNLSSGLGQTISVRAVDGCADTDPFNIHPPLQFNATLATLLDCQTAPNNNAEIAIDVTAGSGSYDYEIDGPGAVDQARTAMGGSSLVWSDASVAGSYTVTVYDTSTSVPNCLGSIIVDVPALVTPTFNIDSFTDVTCNGDDNGTIDVSAVDNGIGPFTFEIISGPGSGAAFPIAPTSNTTTTASFSGLEGAVAGITYTIEITAANGCTFTQTQVISEPDVIANVNTSVVEFGCATGNNMDNATITINAASITGGSGNYVIYEFINDQGTLPTGDDVVVQSGANNIYTETNTTGGSYIINVYDDNGCLGTTNETINAFDELLSTSVSIDAAATCVVGEEITITATGSITNSTTTPANYEFRLLPAGAFQPSGSFTGLTVGVHNFEVRNTITGCIIGATHTVVDPEILDLVVSNTSDVTCFGDTDGTVELDLQDAATLTYASATTYTLYYDVNNTPGNLADDTVTAGGDADGNFTITGLAAGNYYIEVTDTNPPGSACVYAEAFAILGPNVGISANTQVTAVTCALNDGVIEVINPAGGWGGYTYFVDLASNPAPTFPASYQAAPQFTGLAGGAGAGTDYQVWVADTNGCEFQLPNVNLVDPTAITATLQINQENCTALQGEIEVVGTAGGQGINYSYQLVRNSVDVGSPKTGTVFSGLGAGSYEVRITDQWSCSTTIGPVVLLDEMVATAAVVKPIDCTVDPGGHITITVNGGSVNLTYDVLFPDAVTTASNATGVFTGLTQAGTYTFTVTDGDTVTPCTVVVTQDLDAPVVPVIDNVAMDPVSCNGGSDGILTVELNPASAVNPIYNFELYEMSNLVVPYRAAQASNVFDNLPQGDYRVRVISSRSCDAFFDQTVTEPTALNVSALATAFVCNTSNAVNTSTITVTAAGGTGPYLYSIDNVNFQASNTFEVVDTGVVQNITAFVTDANSCAQTAVVAPIQPINVFTVAVTQNTAISCANPEEVLVTVTDDGNPGNTYTYELLPVGNPLGSLTSNPTNVTATFELTQPGSYTIRVTDNTTGCFVDATPYDIAPYDLIDVVATPTAPAICFGDSNGAMEINVTGYTGTYDYEVFNGDGTTTGVTGSANTTTNPLSIPGFSGGNYFVRVTQTANPLCVEDSNTITIASPDMALAATPIEVANVTCADNLGEIEVSPTGGFAPYDIQLTNTTTSQVYNISNVVSFVFQGLSAGLFDVEITDNAGCTINEPITLTAPTPITADIDATPTNLVCYGDTNATVTAINVLNGRGVYQYVLNVYDSAGTTIINSSGAQSNPAFNNLGAGTYSITVSDGWSCDMETVQVTISEPVEVMANLIQLSPLTCTTQGQIELSAAGGTGPYQYSTDGVLYTNMAGGNTHTFTVPDGAYQYFVRDAFGCEAMISNQVTVDPIVPLDVLIDASAATVNCTGEASAIILANAVGGLGNYSYELFSDPGLTSSVAGPQNTGDFRNLIAGTYYVHVTSMDCQATSIPIDIIDPAPLQIDRQESTDVTCSGLEDGTITVEVSGGTGDIFYAITPNLDQFDTVGTFTDLAPGIYDVIAQDRNGCFETFQFEIEQPTPIQAQAINVMHEVCFNSADGEFELDITGGTAPYFTSLNSNADADFVQDQVLFQNLPASTHVVFVRDAQGCETNVIVEINPGVNLAAEVTPVYECDGNLPTNRLDIVFEDTTVLADVMYALDSADPNDLQLTADFINIAPGDHFLTIAHSNGCINTVDFSITGFEPLTLLLENNNINEITAVAGGGLEDYTFIFDGVDNGTDNTYIINRTDTYEVTVIDQNGCEVTMEIFMEFIDIEVPDFFTPDGDGLNDRWLPDNLEAFPNVLMIIFDRYGRELYRMGYGDAGWSGIYNNSELPTGDYWYIIKLQGENDDRELVGHFTLYRQ
ncbi:T9SS type B sorting domain-containing protein [Muricauda sp. 2012CJ35-5]|uniref:T9SS type B sorting domain-containing protein n=1 Tax=Flagellimonas spongiicola TaxID=2942208 RepID=A0ABT0PS94_9FLAO|nr:T9SS type B sorting domain-containing protein [Allomuricauda spongiicola]MCL6274248.1 T9SS type B sorting domain-containing protein [Allomuricauda spongiicola]